MKGYSRQPDSGDPTVRDENGGYRKRGYEFSGKHPDGIWIQKLNK
jgi:hypothetical protein